MRLILPVAGDSSRFPGTRPKWLLTHPNGNFMFYESLRGLDLSGVKEILLIAREDHAEKYKIEEAVRRQFAVGEIRLPYRVVIIPPTRSQPQTVALGIQHAGVTGPIFIKDSDNYFETRVQEGNRICTMDLNLVALIDAANKSYVERDGEGRVTNIVEKQVISNTFCVGGYGFARAEDFLAGFAALKDTEGIYVSHVIYSLLLRGTMFESQPVEVFNDWGTLKEWNRYKRKFAVLFVDLDGTLVKNSAEALEPYWGSTGGLDGNIVALNRLFDSGHGRIIIVTSRKQSAKSVTIEQLERLGIRYHDILFDIPHCRRFIVNDFSPSNPYRSAEAINLPRDTEMLEHMLSGMIED